MEKDNINLWKNAMNFGAVGGVTIAVFRFISTLSNATFSGISILRYVILAMLIIKGTKFLRDKLENGNIKYSRALSSGILISLFAGIIIGFYVIIEFQYIKPELMQEYIILQEEAVMKMTWFPEEQIEEQINRIHQKASPVKYGSEEILNNTLWGLIMSVIIAIFLKKDNPFADYKEINETT